MTYAGCPHDSGWWAGTDRVRHCIGCGLALPGLAPRIQSAIKHDTESRPKLRLIKGGKEERDVHDRDLPGGAA